MEVKLIISLFLLTFLSNSEGIIRNTRGKNKFPIAPEESRISKSCSFFKKCHWKPETKPFLDYIPKRRWKLHGKGEKKESGPKHLKHFKTEEELFPRIVYLKNYRSWKVEENNRKEKGYYKKEESSEKKEDEKWYRKRENGSGEERKARKSKRKEFEGSWASEEERSSEEEEGEKEFRRYPEITHDEYPPIHESGEKYGSSEERKKKKHRRQGWHWHHDHRHVGWLWHPPIKEDIWQEDERYRD